MALLAESVVEEWLNRNGFFTIRGIKHGVGELDLLGIKKSGDSITGWHVEVQASFRPIGYISKLTKDLAKSRGRSSIVARRTAAEMAACARQWVRDKFEAEDKRRVREKYWPGLQWEFHLVHGIAKYPDEIALFKSAGINCHSLYDILKGLQRAGKGAFSGSAGGDLAEIVFYYNKERSLALR